MKKVNMGLKSIKKPNFKAGGLQKLKIFLGITGGLLAAVYLAFLFVLPAIVDLDKFTPQISSEVEKLTGFKLKTTNLKLKTSWRLGVKVKADDIALNYQDNSPLFDLKSPEIEINLPTILIGHINLDTIKAKNADVYLIFDKNKKYTIVQYIDKILSAQAEEKPAETAQENNFNFPIELRNINIKAEKIALHLKDENVNKTYLAQLNNSNLRMKSLNGPLKLETEGFIGIENSDVKFLTANVNFKTKFPKTEAQNAQKTENEAQIEIPEFNINPLKTLEDFNLDTNIIVNLDIKDIDDFKAKGSVNIDKFSIKLEDYQLPKSSAKVDFKDKSILINSDVKLSNNEALNLTGNVKTGKKGRLNLNAKTEKITLASLKNLIGAVLNICLIENDLKNIAATGYIKSDFSLDTDYKTVKSKGYLKLIDGDLSYPKANIKVSKIGSFLDFSDNALKIKDTNATVNGAKFEINGEIASNADINLNIKSDPLKIKDLINLAVEFKAVNPKDIADFEFNDGLLTLLVNVIGDFNNIKPKADIDLSQLSLIMKSAKMPINIENIKITARPKGKDDIDASVVVKNITAKMPEPKLDFSAQKAELALNMQEITVKPANALLEGTKILLEGKILNYMKNPELALKASGSVHPNTIFAFIPKEFRTGILHNGQMPYSANITGTLDNIKIAGAVTSNPANYFSIVEIPSSKGQENILNLDMALKNDLLDISDISIKSNSTKIAYAKGVVKNIYAPEPVLLSFNAGLPNKIKISIPMLNGANFNAAGNLVLNGRAFSPEITGNIDLDAFNYPDFGLTLENLALNFNKTVLNAKLRGAKVANSDFAGDANISTNFAKGVTINSLNYNSNYIDSDALIALAEKAMSTMPAPAPSSTGASGSAAAADIGVTIKTGKAKITKLKSGTLNITDINYDHTLLKNVYSLNNLSAGFAGGLAQGKCTYNVINGKIGADMKAENIIFKDAAKAFVGLDVVKSGTLAGKAKVTLSGATQLEQMKSLNGTVSFEIKDGKFGENINFARFLNAANVLNLSGALKNALTTANSKLSSIDTASFKEMSGILTFNNGIASVSTFKSQGENMSLYANGTYNLLNNYANLKITGRVSQKVAGNLGLLATDKIQTQVDKVATAAQNAVDKISEKYSENKGVQAGLAILGAIKTAQTGAQTQTSVSGQTGQSAGQTVSNLIKQTTNPIFGTIPSSDIANVPALTTGETQGVKQFQVALNGPITNPKAVKSFKINDLK